MKIKPAYGYLHVELEDRVEKTEAGLYLPDSVNDMFGVAKVVGTGTGARNIDGTISEMIVKPGDRIVIHKGNVVEVETQRQKFTLLDEKHILAVIKD